MIQGDHREQVRAAVRAKLQEVIEKQLGRLSPAVQFRVRNYLGADDDFYDRLSYGVLNAIPPMLMRRGCGTLYDGTTLDMACACTGHCHAWVRTHDPRDAFEAGMRRAPAEHHGELMDREEWCKFKDEQYREWQAELVKQASCKHEDMRPEGGDDPQWLMCMNCSKGWPHPEIARVTNVDPALDALHVQASYGAIALGIDVPVIYVSPGYKWTLDKSRCTHVWVNQLLKDGWFRCYKCHSSWDTMNGPPPVKGDVD